MIISIVERRREDRANGVAHARIIWFSRYMQSKDIENALARVADPKRAKLSQRYFKTGPGEYAEGDIFLGVPVPAQRAVAKQFYALSFDELDKLLVSPIHEHRFTALVILVRQFARANEQMQKRIFEFYLAHSKYINNWDLVDVSAPKIVGEYLWRTGEQKTLLAELGASRELWRRRIAVLATSAFIMREDFVPTLTVAKQLLSDEHDLIHKAVGWMLREVGKRDRQTLLDFLDRYYKQMPRTALRYAIERLDRGQRTTYLQR